MISTSTARLLDIGWQAGEAAAKYRLDFELCRFVMRRHQIPVRARPTVRAAFFRALKFHGVV